VDERIGVWLDDLANCLTIRSVRVVRSTRGEHDAPVIGHAIEQQLHEQEVPEDVGGERLLVAVHAIGDGPVELGTRIAQDGLQLLYTKGREQRAAALRRGAHRLQ
jgi:hypothetical protein